MYKGIDGKMHDPKDPDYEAKRLKLGLPYVKKSTDTTEGEQSPA